MQTLAFKVVCCSVSERNALYTFLYSLWSLDSLNSASIICYNHDVEHSAALEQTRSVLNRDISSNSFCACNEN